MEGRGMNTRESGALFAVLCVVIALVIFTSMPVYRGLADEVSEQSGLGAAMVMLREGIEQNESVSAFLGLSNDTESEDNIDLAQAVAAYIAEHTPQAPAFVLPLEGILTSAHGVRVDPFYTGDLRLLSEGNYETHHGLDISPTASSEICAAMAGEVIHVGSDPDGYGNYLILRHESCDTLYAHCSSILVRAGDTVEAGDAIAVVGMTGRATGIHLHFEVFVDGESVDPSAYFGIFGNEPTLS